MQEIRHRDRHGKPWSFTIDCTPYQSQILSRLLAVTRNIGNREALGLPWYDNAEDNAAFCEYVENAILSGIERAQSKFIPTPREEPELIAADDTPEEPKDYEPIYYWEQF